MSLKRQLNLMTRRKALIIELMFSLSMSLQLKKVVLQMLRLPLSHRMRKVRNFKSAKMAIQMT